MSANLKLSKRLLLELKEFNQNRNEISHLKELKLKEDSNLFEWFSLLFGPLDSIFNDHTFELDIQIPIEYPSKPPKISFKQQTIFHPNITFKTGEICLDILKENWSPVWTIATSCLAVQTLLACPESSSPLNVDAANLLRCGDILGYESLAKMYIELSEES